MKSITIGLDIAKSVFQVHGEDGSGKIIIQKRLRRSQVEGFFAELPPSLVGSRRAGRRTTGRGCCGHWATRCG